MTDKSLTQRGTVRRLKTPLTQQMADARVRAATRARNREAAFEAVQKAAGAGKNETGNA